MVTNPAAEGIAPIVTIAISDQLAGPELNVRCIVYVFELVHISAKKECGRKIASDFSCIAACSALANSGNSVGGSEISIQSSSIYD